MNTKSDRSIFVALCVPAFITIGLPAMSIILLHIFEYPEKANALVGFMNAHLKSVLAVWATSFIGFFFAFRIWLQARRERRRNDRMMERFASSFPEEEVPLFGIGEWIFYILLIVGATAAIAAIGYAFIHM